MIFHMRAVLNESYDTYAYPMSQGCNTNTSTAAENDMVATGTASRRLLKKVKHWEVVKSKRLLRIDGFTSSCSEKSWEPL